MMKAKNGLVLVVFSKSWRQYTTGVTAGFLPDEAAKLVAGGVAYYKGTEPAEAPKAEEKPTDTGDNEPKKDPIPENFRDMKGPEVIALAKQHSDAPINSKADAIAALELALEEAKAGNNSEQ